MAESRPHAGIELILSVQEEIGLLGAKARRLLAARSAHRLRLRPRRRRSAALVTACPSQYSIDATFLGRAAHAGIAPEQGRNAIAAAAHALAEMRFGRLDDETTANVGTIAGGIARNVVADRCDVRLEVRSRDHERALKESQAMLDALAHAANAAECELETAVSLEYRAYKLRRTRSRSSRSPGPHSRAAAIAPELHATGGGADAHVFNADGIPCVNIANGMELIHTADERIAVADIETMVDVTLALVEGARTASCAPTAGSRASRCGMYTGARKTDPGGRREDRRCQGDQAPGGPRRADAGRRARARRPGATTSSSRRAPAWARGFPDDAYVSAGASLAACDDVWDAQPSCCSRSRSRSPTSTRSCARAWCSSPTCTWRPAPELTQALIDSGATCVAYETVETDDHRLPLLAPMSEVAGRLAPQMGAHALEKAHGGRGVLLGGVAGVPPGKVVVLGGGIVGYNAALIAVGMQADVWVLDRSIDRMRELDPMLDGRATVAMSNTLQVEEAISEADLVIGAVLVHGARAPKLVTRDMLGLMKPGSVLVDVAIDQGGCFETSRPTTHRSRPTRSTASSTTAWPTCPAPCR